MKMIRAKSKILFSVLLLAALISLTNVIAQKRSSKKSFQKPALGVIGADKRPDLVEPYKNNLQLRTNLRPRIFRKGDILNILVVVRDYGKEAVYLEKSRQPVFSLVDENGAKIKIIDSYRDIAYFPSKNLFITLSPTGEWTANYDLLLGCGESLFYSEKLTEQEIFEQAQFAYYGQGCINFNNQTKIYLRAEVSNELAVTEQAKDIEVINKVNALALKLDLPTVSKLKISKIKTAVGQIESKQCNECSHFRA